MRKLFKEKLLLLLMSCTIISTCINIFTIGVTQTLFFPASNFLVIMFTWIYRVFDYLPCFVLGCILLLLLFSCFMMLLISRKKAVPFILTCIYGIDVLVIALLATRSWLWTIPFALLFDLLVIYIAIQNIMGHRTGDGL